MMSRILNDLGLVTIRDALVTADNRESKIWPLSDLGDVLVECYSQAVTEPYIYEYICQNIGTSVLRCDSWIMIYGNIENLLPDFFLEVPGQAQNATKSKENSAASGQIPVLFDTISKSITPELVKKTQAVYQFNVKGQEAGVWHLDLKNEPGTCGSGEPPAVADATLTMDGKHFAEMFAGKLKPTTAFMMGKLKISGDLPKAMKLEKLMKSLKNKM